MFTCTLCRRALHDFAAWWISGATGLCYDCKIAADNEDREGNNP